MKAEEKIKIYKTEHDRLNEGLGKSVLAIRDGIVLNVGNNDYPRFGYEFFTFRSPEMVEEMTQFIENCKGKKLFWDIGAYHGIFSLVYAKLNPNGHAVCFEPDADAARIIMNIAAENNIPNITILDYALSNYEGRMPMIFKHGHLSAFILGEDVYDEEKFKDYDCKVGDDLTEYYGYPDLIKIDVEGNELATLGGMTNCIKYGGKPTILLEVHIDRLSEQDVNECLVKLPLQYGYAVQYIQQDNYEGQIRVVLK